MVEYMLSTISHIQLYLCTLFSIHTSRVLWYSSRQQDQTQDHRRLWLKVEFNCPLDWELVSANTPAGQSCLCQAAVLFHNHLYHWFPHSFAFCQEEEGEQADKEELAWCTHGWATLQCLSTIWLGNMHTLRLCSGTFLHTTSYDNQKRPQHTTQTHNKHHYHGGGAACPSSSVDSMNPHCPRGGWPCAYIVRGCYQRILLDSIN